MVTPEILWGLTAALVLALAALLLYTPVYLSVRGEAGYGALAVGVVGIGVGPLGAAFEQQAGGARRVRLYLFKRCVLDRPVPPRRAEPEAEPKEDDLTRGVRRTLERILRGLDRWERYLGIADTVVFIASERRRVKFDEVRGRIKYGFPEYEKTGRLCGHLWTLQGVLGPHVRLAQMPDWSGKTVLAGAGRVQLRLYPVWFAIDLFGFILRQFAFRSRRSRTLLAARISGGQAR